MHFSLKFCEIENRDSIDLSLWTEYIFNRLQKYSQSNNFFFLSSFCQDAGLQAYGIF